MGGRVRRGCTVSAAVVYLCTWAPVVMAAVRKPVLLGLPDAAVHGHPTGPAAWSASKLGGLPVRWGASVGVGGC